MKVKEWAKGFSYIFYCPGCKEKHMFWLKEGEDHPSWQWNWNYKKPTVTPSIVLDVPEKRCHLNITNGQIIFHADCWHELAGQTMEFEINFN